MRTTRKNINNNSNKKIILGYKTAFAFMRYARFKDAKIFRVNSSKRHIGGLTTKQAKFLLSYLQNLSVGSFLYNKVDVLLDNSRLRSNKEFIKYYCVPRIALYGNFIRYQFNKSATQSVIENNIMRALETIVFPDPCILLLELAQVCSYIEVLYVALEMCGTYTIIPRYFNENKKNENSPSDEKNKNSFLNNSEPILSTNKLITFLSNNPNLKGTKGFAKLADVSKFVIDNLNSPAEAKLYIKMCGPRKFGCYQLKKPLSNVEVSLSNHAKQIAGQSTIKPDFIYPDKKLAIEYDSTQYHDNEEQDQKDKRRIDALISDEWKVISIVASQVNNTQTLESIVKSIMRFIGQDTRIKTRDFRSKQAKTFNCLRGL